MGLCAGFCFGLSAFAGPQDGTITALSGTVELLTQPSKQLQKTETRPHALFEGLYYLYQPARLGDRVGNGVYVRVAPGSKAQIVFDNGDQVNLGSGTLYRGSWKQDVADASAAAPKVDLPYGKLHTVISKGGPRSKLQLRSKTMVMGVRGTEFSVVTAGEQAAAVSVLRGEVEVAPTVAQQATSAKMFKIVESQTAQVQAASGASSTPTIDIKKTAKEDIEAIRKITELPQAPNSQKKPPVVEALQKKAASVTLQDIKTYHPEQVKELGLTGDLTVSEIRAKTLAQAQSTAPSTGQKSLYERDAKDIEDKAYRQYFDSGKQ